MFNTSVSDDLTDFISSTKSLFKHLYGLLDVPDSKLGHLVSTS